MHRNRPDLVVDSKPSGFLAEEAEEVRRLARKEFPAGVLIDAVDFAMAEQRTHLAIASGSRTLFHAAFEFQGIRIRPDILEQMGEKWILRLVTPATSPSGRVMDLALETFVLRSLGLEIEPRIMYLDKTATTESRNLFLETGHEFAAVVEEEVSRIADSHGDVLDVLSSDLEPQPNKTSRCKTCEFRPHCFQGSDRGSVLDLYRGGKRIDSLIDQGREDLREIPLSGVTNEIQVRQIFSAISGQPWISEGLADELETVEYPLHFLDFEVAAPAIPRFDNQHPYDRLPFQWSCHIQDKKDGGLDHQEWLHSDQSDPRREFCESLLEALGTEGSILVYSGFERATLTTMARLFPDLEEPLEAVILRLWDLCACVRSHFYHPEFKGSFSIKKVLPAICPELTYEGMEVGDGMAAVEAWREMIGLPGGDPRKEKTKRDLL